MWCSRVSSKTPIDLRFIIGGCLSLRDKQLLLNNWFSLICDSWTIYVLSRKKKKGNLSLKISYVLPPNILLVSITIQYLENAVFAEVVILIVWQIFRCTSGMIPPSFRSVSFPSLCYFLIARAEHWSQHKLPGPFWFAFGGGKGKEYPWNVSVLKNQTKTIGSKNENQSK